MFDNFHINEIYYNDDQLIKMAAIVQRMYSKAASISSGDFNLTEEEKEMLLQELSQETQKELTELKMLRTADDNILDELIIILNLHVYH